MRHEAGEREEEEAHPGAKKDCHYPTPYNSEEEKRGAAEIIKARQRLNEVKGCDSPLVKELCSTIASVGGGICAYAQEEGGRHLR